MNRAPSTTWCLRRDFRDSVRTVAGDLILIFVNDRWIEMDRATARLLAKRINQCLDATVKR